MELIAANWVVVEAAAVTLLAPIAAVSLARARSAGSASLRFCGAVAAFVALASASAAALNVPVPSLVRAQLVVAAAAFAFGAIGFCATAIFTDVLDAAACSLVAALLLSGGVFVAGGPLADASTTALNGALTASPIVAAAAAADVDLFRSAFLYDRSPVAHRLFHYPDWYMAAALYLAIAAAAAFVATWRSSARRRALPGK